MSNLFRIGHEFAELFEQYDEIFESGDADAMQAWWDTMEGIDGEFKKTAAEIALRIKELSAEADAIEEEIDALTERMESRDKRAEDLTRYLMNAMAAMGIEKIDDPRVVLSVRDNPESVEIANKAEFIRWATETKRGDLLRYGAPSVALSAVKTAIKSGETIPGASVVRTKRLEVK